MAAFVPRSDIPHRLDRLPWSRFHTLVATALGVTWVLDGLEVTLAGTLGAALADPKALGLSAGEVGLSASFYLLGAVSGAIVFGFLADRFGRKRLFTVTLGLYLVATAATAFSWDLWSFCLFRFLTGAGIGGEYSAINSAIQELIPARYRGRTDLAINGSFWAGAALGAGMSIVLLDPDFFGADTGWRIAFFSGAVLGLAVLWLRRFLPESPRWLLVHGRLEEAEVITVDIERRMPADLVAAETGHLEVHRPVRATFGIIMHTLFKRYPGRTFLCVVLMGSQAFLYNTIFFTYALILANFYGVKAEGVGWHILFFAAGNLLGPLLLGKLFDEWGRKPMIAGCYALSGILLAIIGFLFQAEILGAWSQTFAWSVIFFFASAAASAAYLTVGEVFPIEIRANAISLFYAFGTGVGGVAGPWIFGRLIDTGERSSILIGYLIAAGLMLTAAILEAIMGIKAERQPLESVTPPLSSQAD